MKQPIYIANAFLMGIAEANKIATTSFYGKQAKAYDKGRRLTHKFFCKAYQVITLSPKKPFRYDY